MSKEQCVQNKKHLQRNIYCGEVNEKVWEERSARCSWLCLGQCLSNLGQNWSYLYLYYCPSVLLLWLSYDRQNCRQRNSWCSEWLSLFAFWVSALFWMSLFCVFLSLPPPNLTENRLAARWLGYLGVGVLGQYKELEFKFRSIWTIIWQNKVQ